MRVSQANISRFRNVYNLLKKTKEEYTFVYFQSNENSRKKNEVEKKEAEVAVSWRDKNMKIAISGNGRDTVLPEPRWTESQPSKAIFFPSN